MIKFYLLLWKAACPTFIIRVLEEGDRKTEVSDDW
jgi:hypothetical protein